MTDMRKMVENITAMTQDLDTKGLLWFDMASREKAFTQNSTADLYPEVLL
jgi:hypothetical protein